MGTIHNTGPETEQPETEQPKEPNWIWKFFAIIIAISALAWIVIQNYRVEPPVGPPPQVDNLDDDLLESLIEDLKETLLYCEQTRDETCIRAINELLEGILYYSTMRNMRIGDLLDRLSFIRRIIITECYDVHEHVYIEILYDWPKDDDDEEQNRACEDFVVFEYATLSGWQVKTFEIRKSRLEPWKDFLKREGLPPLPVGPQTNPN